jgi:hypothetical protein
MDAVSIRSIAIVAGIQLTIALMALFCSPLAALAAGAIGVLALMRYVSEAFYASTLASSAKSALRLFAGSAWFLGLIALGVALVAIAIKAKPVLPWAVAAALAGPFGFSIFALGSGIVKLTSARPGHAGGNR